MGVFPSGQWGQTVNLLLSASVVRIHPRPPRTPVSNGYRSFCFICLEKGDARVDSNSCGAVAEDSAKTAQWAVFSSAARAIHPRPPRTPVSNGYRSFCFICLEKGMQGWIRTAAEPTAACGGNREARLGQRSAFSKPCQGAAEKAASATRKTRRIVRREKSPCATATTAASGRNREELLGLRPAGCACRPRHDAAAGSRDPGSFSARLAQSTRAHQKTATYQNTLRFCFTILFLLFLLRPPIRAAVLECCFEQ